MKEGIVDVFDQWFQSKLVQMHTCIPGYIVQYYGHSERKAKVQPAIKLRTIRNKVVNLEPIDDVPVLFPGSSDFNITYPLKKGDGVLLMFSEASIGEFLTSRGNVVTADNPNRFTLTDCMAIPGLWSFSNVPTEGTATYIQLQSNGNLDINAETGKEVSITNGTCEVKMDSTTVTLNDGVGEVTLGPGNLLQMLGGSEAFIKGTTFINILTPLVTALSNLVVAPPAVPLVRGDLAAVQAAAATLLGLLSTAKSTTITGE